MMKLASLRWPLVGVVLIVLWVPNQTLAQTPLGPDFLVNSRLDYIHGTAVGCNDSSTCAFTWAAGQPAEEGNNTWLFGKSFSAQGEVIAERLLRMNDFTRLAPVIGLPGGFAIVWDKVSIDERGFGHGGPALQLFDESLRNLTEVIELPFEFPTFLSVWSAARTPAGYVLLTQGDDLPVGDPQCEPCYLGVFLYFVDEDGKQTRERQRVNEDPSDNEQPNGGSRGLAVDGAGNIIATFWRGYRENLEDLDVFVRRFSPDGQPLGPEVRINSYLPGYQWQAQVAAAPSGEFVVVWQSAAQDGELEGIYARRFSADGVPLGDEFRVNEVTRSAQRFPTVASDRQGNFAVTWQDFVPGDDGTIVFQWDIKARLFRSDGTPITGEILVNQERNFEQIGSLVAFPPNGTLLIGWASQAPAPASGQLDVRARRFAASVGDEPCAVAGAKLFCDTGRTGGVPELSLIFGGRPGEVTLLGDADADGREDVCAWYKGRFRCDTDHEGPPAELRLPFGLLTDIPLLGDVDGDGKAEACVRRKRRLLCDTSHDGGRAETTIVLGKGTETPLLGDLDQDGRDDLCLFEAGQWTCLTRAGVRSSIGFGIPGDLPALGDLDNDGRSDPCVLRVGQLLCDTAHDGGAAEMTLGLEVPAGARLLFGNLDGL